MVSGLFASTVSPPGTLSTVGLTCRCPSRSPAERRS